MPNVATTLNNLAILHADKQEFEDALQKFEESTEIYRELIIRNFQTYFPYFAGNLGNLSLFYQREIPQREKSIGYAIEAMLILLPYIEKVPFTQRYMQTAMSVLRNWDLSDEEISQMIEEKMKENNQN